jgi:hypothetical protein
MKNLFAQRLILIVLAFFWPLIGHASLTEAQKQKVSTKLKQNTAAEYVVTVDFGKQRFRFATFIPDFESPTDGIPRQQRLTGWKGDYLFVRHQCGSISMWRCFVDQIFTIKNNKLIHIGAVESGNCSTLGCRYDLATDLFQDLYDIYQINPVSGERDSAPLPIARRVKDNTFVTDLDATWKMNQTAYQASIACLDQVAKSGFETPCAQNQTAWSALTFVAKLTHYTNRISERDALFANQAVSYCMKSADEKCQWRVNGVKDFFQRFSPGANPSYVPSPVTLTSTSVEEPKILTPQKLETGKAIKLKL